MIDQFLDFISKQELFHPGDKILLAVSGGLDSTVMTDLFHGAGVSFAIAHCNFGLRGEESDRDEHFVRQLADRYQVQLFVRRFETTTFARKHKLSIQMAARKLRYEWFDDLLDREGYAFVATAHHLDDQIETFLINLSRGTGIAGLHGILPKQGRIIRPLLFASRQNIQDFAGETHLPFVEDSSNASLKYARNRIRHKIIPQFEKLNPAFRAEMTETILNLREVESIYRDLIEHEKRQMIICDKEMDRIPVERLSKLSPPRTWLYELLSDYNFTLPVVEDIIHSLAKQSGKIFYSESHQLVRDRGFLIIRRKSIQPARDSVPAYPDPTGELPVQLEFRLLEDQSFGGFGDHDIAFLDFEKLNLPLTIRRWRRGDYFYPLGMKNRRKLSDFFIDLKYSLPQKENTWLLCSGDDIAWIIGARLDDRFKVTSETTKVLRVEFLEDR